MAPRIRFAVEVGKGEGVELCEVEAPLSCASFLRYGF
jgi:hypothetical protein